MRKKVNERAKRFGRNLKEVRQMLKLKGQDMAVELGVSKNTYYRNETGQFAPQLETFIRIAKRFNISLDWLILNRGEMRYKPAPAKAAAETAAALDEEIREMVEYMNRVPSLRYELLAQFHRYKESHPEKS